ncbi:hypothetical protein GQ53DRAFT_746413 [Thozetella sp. PMI_491]|nr:hypothetical protein GQ53DRAFT_746413 [Thozetella sp. PMI_491]
MPLEFDQSRSNEPFLRLPPPYQNIILTPPRKSDGPRVVECLNDPKVYTSLLGPPFPYTHQNFEFWYNSIEKQCAEGLKQYLEVKGGMDGSGEQGKRKWANACPVRIIREVNPETGAQEFIGDLGIDRHGYSGETKDQQDKLRELNYSYEDGDERIDWDIGGKFAPPPLARGWQPPRGSAAPCRHLPARSLTPARFPCRFSSRAWHHDRRFAHSHPRLRSAVLECAQDPHHGVRG